MGTVNKKTNTNIKRWIISSCVTFLSGFALMMVGEIDNITLESIKTGGIGGIIFVSVRAGFKALLEAFLLWRKK